MSQEAARFLSAELLAVADSLRKVRAQLGQMLAAGAWPEGAWPDISTVQVLGHDVTEALVRLAKGSEPTRRTPTPYDPDVRM